MTFVYLPGTVSRLTFNVPVEACCNCGTSQGISVKETPLKKTRYMLLGGTELRFAIDLPYCKTCTVTAKRFPAGVAHKLLVSFGVFWVLFFAAFVMPVDLSPFIVDHITAIAGVVALALTFGFYSLRKAVPPQTSYYQPVTLKAVKQEFSGTVVGIALQCSHATFARNFSEANKESVAAGVLTVTQG